MSIVPQQIFHINIIISEIKCGLATKLDVASSLPIISITH